MRRYEMILKGEEKAKFLTAKEKGILQKKMEEGWKVMESCELCERKCGVNRLKGEKGFCGVGSEWKIFGAHTHWGEEDILIPSATLFQSGCTMKCVYCQNAPESLDYNLGITWSVEKVSEWIEMKYKEGCKNVNFVGGDPTPYIPHIIKALSMVKVNIPVVFNSNAYFSEKAMMLLKDVVDVFLLDFRYFSDRCARDLSSAPKYPEVAKRNHILAEKYGELLIRVLVIPGHIECDAKPILKWISENLSDKVRVNILSQYHPWYKAYRYPEINRVLSYDEYLDVLNYAKDLGLNLC